MGKTGTIRNGIIIWGELSIDVPHLTMSVSLLHINVPLPYILDINCVNVFIMCLYPFTFTTPFISSIDECIEMRETLPHQHYCPTSRCDVPVLHV